MEDSVIVDRLSEVGFRIYSENEILKLSVKEITNPQLFDNLQLPTVGGLYDPALGSTRNDEVCTSCGQSGRFCPGHMAHINLALPVFNPIFFKTLLKILQGTCLFCHRLYVTDVEGSLFMHQMELLDMGGVVAARELQQFVWEFQAEKEDDADIFKAELVERIEKLAKDLKKAVSSDVNVCTKMADTEISLLVNTMLKRFFATPKTCPHCRSETLALRQEYFTHISAKRGRERRPSAKKAPPKKQPLPAQTVPPETEADMEVEVEESEERDEVDNLLAKGKGQCLIMPHLARQILRRVWKKDSKVLGKVFRCLEEVSNTENPTDSFFLSALLVPPSRFRPLSVMGDRKFENPQTSNLARVLLDNYEIRQLLVNMNLDLNKSEDLTVEKESSTPMEQLQEKWIRLQTHVNCLIDSDLDKFSLAQNKIPGIRQLLEKKEGLFRMHMMGKRVNFAARSVISPDPCINTNEIGVPVVFAQKLTYPQPVTPWNVQELRQYVINGPENYPGAFAVVNEDGSVTKLSAQSHIQREAIAKQLLTPSDPSGKNLLPKQVLRHLRNGDVMLLNRQPTLHRPSIQAHRARVLPGIKALRLHYSNCKAYNADFDGDEMNAHFPQSELCRAEAYGIASTDYQYLVPKDGSPLAGLIQDHLVAGVSLTVRGQFFSREEYFQLLQSALTDVKGKLKSLPPSIVKPCSMWSGKQVISSVLLNLIPKDRPPLSMEGKAKIKEKSWIQRHVEKDKPYLSLSAAQNMTEDLGESTVIVDQGELLQGVLDKAQCGPSSFGLVHCVYELYGGEVAGKLLTCLGRLFTAFLKQRGFTLGIEDILVEEKAEVRRRKKIKKAPKEGHKAALEAFGTTGEDCSDAELLRLLKEAQFGKDDMALKQLDNSAKKITNDVSEKVSLTIIGKHLFKSFPDNNLQLMVQSGAKGGSVNCIQISSMLGQIELEGRRPPLMKSGRSLPSYLPYDLSLKAGGFVTGRFLTGIRPQEYFFHCMAGREGLIDTAVKTSRSGYLQRCLIKHLEGLMISYDMTVRDSDASVIQFLYGEDGLEVCKTPFLEEKQFPFLLKNQDVWGDQKDTCTKDKKVEKHKKKVEKWQEKHPRSRTRDSAFLDLCCAKQEDEGFVNKYDTKPSEKTGRSALSAALEVEWRGLDTEIKHKLLKKHERCLDPVISKYSPQLHTGAISESMLESVRLIQQQLGEVAENSSERVKEQSKAKCQALPKLVHSKVMRSLAQPGEAVGLLCAQSIGEPSTQMTLNTFHFAGRGEMNVTLGIPRLREVLMTASACILTPSMEIPILDTPQAQAAAESLQKRLSLVYLSDVLQEMQICEYLHSAVGSLSTVKDRKRLYRIHFKLLPRKSFSDKLKMKSKEIIKHIEKGLIGRVARAVHKFMDKREQEKTGDLVSQSTVRSVVSREEDAADDTAGNDGDSDVEVGDGDATAEKALSRHTDSNEYEGEEEEREEVGDATQPEDVEEDAMEEGEQAMEDEEDDDDGDHDEIQEAEDIEAVKSIGCVHDYRRDKKGKWCEVTLQFKSARFLVDMKSMVEREARRLVVQQVKGIKRCMLLKQADRYTGQSRLHLVTEGINLQEMMKYNHILDLNSLYTNSIHDVQNTYGIEAANRAIIKEVQNVFKPYEIQVNPRHLSLLADYMTCEGCYKGFNRAAISSNPSPLQKITFETSMNFLVSACMNARPDQLRSPSARIVTGQVVSCGTGTFEIMQPLQV